MRFFLSFLIFIFLTHCSSQSSTNNVTEGKTDPFPSLKLDSLVQSYSLNNTLELHYEDNTIHYYYNRPRASLLFPAASTFKMPNTLIALQEKIITDSTILVWDGVERGLPAWNQNQNIYTAYKNSTVWFYQALARKLNIPTYEKYLQKMEYGNEKVGTALDQFWLNGTLRISAEGQINFLEKLYKKQLPFSKSTFATGEKIMTEWQNDSLQLIAKTGLSVSNDSTSIENVGWYVGYVKKKNKPTLFFAHNMFCNNTEDRKYRKEVVFKILQELGYYP